MTQITQLNGKYSCQDCGNAVNVSDKRCWHCRKDFSGMIKTANVPKPVSKPHYTERRKLTREDIVRKKVRENRQLVVEDFVSIRKLDELMHKGEKISIMV